MMTKLTLLLGCVVVALLLGVASAQETIIVLEPVYLTLEDGSNVLLPPGNYTSIEKIAGVWYVDGEVYPAADTEIPDYLPEDDLFAYVIIGCVVVGVIGVVLVMYVRQRETY